MKISIAGTVHPDDNRHITMFMTHKSSSNDEVVQLIFIRYVIYIVIPKANIAHGCFGINPLACKHPARDV